MRFILACRSRCHTLCTPRDMLPENPISTRVKLKPSSGENYDDYTIVLLLCEKYKNNIFNNNDCCNYT